SALVIRLVMAFNTVSILLVISLCCCLKLALNLVSPRLFFSGLKVYHLPPASSVVSEQDELPSSVGLDFQARLDGGRMYLGHLEAKRLP
ncbi:hypothetical protein Tco_0312287, partial [Tanacetum coccineum]